MLPLCFANAPLSGRQVLCINGSVCNASLLDRGEDPSLARDHHSASAPHLRNI